MKVGITFDLRDEYLRRGFGEEETAELDSEETVVAIEAALANLGHDPERIGGAGELARRLGRGERWDLVFNIAEGLRGMGRESLVPCILDASGVPYTFSDPAVLGLCLHKGMCKHVVRDLGLPTVPFRVVEDFDDVASVDLEYPLFVKPVAEGTSKGIAADSLITRGEDLWPACRDLMERFRQPVLVEEYLPGMELTVGIMGTGREASVLGAMEVITRGDQAPIYSYEVKENYEELVRYELLPPSKLYREVEILALEIWRGLGCRDAGRMDFRMDAHERPSFMEVNPLAGLNPVRSDLSIMCRLQGREYLDLVSEIVRFATERR